MLCEKYVLTNLITSSLPKTWTWHDHNFSWRPAKDDVTAVAGQRCATCRGKATNVVRVRVKSDPGGMQIPKVSKIF